MSFLIPKKPQILYAPMLGSLGGGSVRGFGRGVGSKDRFADSPWQSYYGATAGPNGAGIINFIVPETGVYGFEIQGASSMPQEYSSQLWPHYGKGANFRGAVSLVSGERIYVAAGSLPLNAWSYNAWDGNIAALPNPSGNDIFNGGGGGTFVAFGGSSYGNANPLIVAGGGGSVRVGYEYDATQVHARVDFITSGHDGGGGPGGTNGNGGTFNGNINDGGSDAGTPGAGFYNDAQSGSYSSYTAAKGFRNSAQGAVAVNIGGSSPQPSGGFGGGGAGGWGGSGGGGGYSGGGAGSNTSTDPSGNGVGYGGGGSNYQDSSRVSEVELVTLASGRGHLKLWLPI